ncbi:acylneuraminate cytidylyltransferase family protein [Sphingomonas sp. C3-2]|uniref:acylneuraminate cytidylyltransferase family protein n=1 Tax=Sphingomonas sp. C3-2 TaxID=3062169 RepID=UPI00294B6D06|nr:acylneuraminate cytidylyltransferase family protein [Sphingomonas sp. C3-2]WOK35105.1 acylneuraminate cytidylyltransferase family protein [Sphingomonas sp. C3-2]
MTARAFIFARGGSKGVPRKNVRLLDGKPLIGYAIDIARACPSLGDVIISTDDDEIAQTALTLGARVPFRRPAELASDTASEWLAWRHAIEWTREHDGGDFDVFVSLPATSPFRAVEDVEACIAMLRNDPAADVVVTVRKAERSPYFNMVFLNDDGAARLVIRPEHGVTRRQDAPQVYDMTTVAYAARPDFVLSRNGIFEGRVRVVEVPPERAMDIDTPYDFAIAEYIARDYAADRGNL